MKPTVVVDGNDGTGKTTLVTTLRAKGFTVQDRGLPTIMTDDTGRSRDEPGHVYLILDCDVSICQCRLLAKGKSLTEKYHTLPDLMFYRGRFRLIADQLPNAYLVDASRSIEDVAFVACGIIERYRAPSGTVLEIPAWCGSRSFGV